MRDEFGFDANLNDSLVGPDASDSPMAVRFSSIPKKNRDKAANSILQKCQIHTCSEFCWINRMFLNRLLPTYDKIYISFANDPTGQSHTVVATTSTS